MKVTDPVARFWPNVLKTDSCWEWMAAIDRKGYGRFWMDGKIWRAHRASLVLSGTDPGSLFVDHKCRNRKCVNPGHLRLVTPRINSIENSNGLTAKRAAQTHCKNGHLLGGDNIIQRPRLTRACKICVTSKKAAYYKMRKANGTGW